MKWGRKKSCPSPPPPSPSSRPSSASHAFPMSWLSRFKNPKSSLENEARIVKGKGKKNSGSPSVLSGDNWNGGRFYGRDDDSYWSLSFRKERLRGEKISGGLKSVWYDSDDELNALPTKTVRATRGDDIPKFDNLVSERRKTRELEALPRSFGCKVNIESTKAERNTREKRALKDQKSRKNHRSIRKEGREFEKESARASLNSTKSFEEGSIDINPVRITQATNKDYQKPIFSDSRRRRSISNSIDLRTIDEDCAYEASKFKESAISEENSSCECPKEKDMKTGGIMLRSETQTFLHLSEETHGRTKQSRKVKAYSPRSAAKIECKIKALEDKKRTRIKMKKMTEERAAKDALNFDSCAVVKCTVNPQQDFRDSMIEMIREKGIRRPEELEDLLACYLTWNCDEYHDLIVKVFREVWVELNEAELHQELEYVNC